METGWEKIKIYTNPIGGEIVKQMLEENNIPAVLLNKQDSSYHFGKLELYVLVEDKAQALALIASTEDIATEDTDAD